MTHPPEVKQAVKILYEYFYNEIPYTKPPENTQQKVPIPKPPTQSHPEYEKIKWMVGRGQDRVRARAPAEGSESYQYAFVTDTNGEIHPEVKPLYNEVCRYGKITIDGWEFTTFGTRAKMLSKRRAKEV